MTYMNFLDVKYHVNKWLFYYPQVSTCEFFTADSVSYFKEYLTEEVFSTNPEFPQKKKIQDLPDESPVKIKEVHDWLTLYNRERSVFKTSAISSLY